MRCLSLVASTTTSDFARRELLGLLGEHDHLRVSVDSNYENTAALERCSLLVSYTCDVRPSEAAQAEIRSWVEAGGRWLALHGTNSALDLGGPNGVDAPRVFPLWAETLGSQFVAHPPIQPYTVETTDADHWLVAGVGEFDTDDELYCMEYHHPDQLVPLLHTTWTGECKGFVEAEWAESGWTEADRHLVQYLRPLGGGEILYNTLGHCRGHWDMAPIAEYYPRVERCSWDKPQYYELLRRAIRWGLGHTA